MSLKFASLLKISVAGAVILSVGACKPAGKGQGALKSEGVAALNLSKSEASVFAKYFEQEDCAVDELEALGALAGLGLGESGANNLEFASRTFENGQVAYRDMVVGTEGAKTFSAKTAVFHCPSMGDEAPQFARLDLTDVTAQDDKGASFTFGTLNIAKPTTQAAAALVNGMLDPNAAGKGNIGFEAISATDVTLKSKDAYGALKSVSWGKKPNEDGVYKADLSLDALEFTAPGKDGAQDMTVNFEGMSIRNLNANETLSPNNAVSANSAIGTLFGNLKIFEKSYDQFLVEKLKVDSEVFTIDFTGIEGKTTEKGGVVTTRQSLKPFVFAFKPGVEDVPSLQRNYQFIKSLGFDKLTLSGSSVTTLDEKDDSISLSDGLLVLEDGFALNFEYSAEGLSDMVAKAKSLSEASEEQDLIAIYDSLKLRDFRLTLEDNSIVERGLKLASEMTGQSETNIKLGLSAAVFFAASAAQNEVQAEVYSETVEAFAEFVKKGGKLTIEANPPAPFAISPLVTGKGEDVDPATLGFSASHEGGK